MPIVLYQAYCPFCKTIHEGKIELKYRKDNLFNVRKRNKSLHVCKNNTCSKEFIVEIDSYGNVIALPTPEIEKDGIFPWEKITEGKILEIKE
ncbi:MAG TPA: hypothetical protein EYP80_02610 [Candidatus Aenigmarchaeota archaeon]|nr:hypothetical protein [Candidatus Aenigmarchaeota archaeon]